MNLLVHENTPHADIDFLGRIVRILNLVVGSLLPILFKNEFPKDQQNKPAFNILPQNIVTAVLVLYCYFVVLPTVDDDDDSDLYMCTKVCW